MQISHLKLNADADALCERAFSVVYHRFHCTKFVHTSKVPNGRERFWRFVLWKHHIEIIAQETGINPVELMVVPFSVRNVYVQCQLVVHSQVIKTKIFV